MKKIGFCTLYLCIFLSIHAQVKVELSKTDMTKLDFKILAESKIKINAKDPSCLPAYKQLLKDADYALKYNDVSVMDKTEFPPSGNKHDYMSIGPYWWPDPSKKNGVPYIRRDGEVNPEVKNYPDKNSMPVLCEKVYNLSLAYYFSGNEVYAKKASHLIKVWFLDTATAMNPNLNFGQAIKGVTDGRAEGLIEIRHFIFLLDGVELIKNTQSFKELNQVALKKWFVEFSKWLQESPIGIDEMNAKNNHSVWFDASSLAIAIFIGDKTLANSIVKRAAERLDTQMDDKGLFPLELARTTSLHYSTFIIDAFTIIASLSEKTDTNFWTLQTKSKKSLQKGYDALIPYWSKNKKWAYQEIRPFALNNAYQSLWRASQKYNCSSCKSIIQKNEMEYERLLIQLL